MIRLFSIALIFLLTTNSFGQAKLRYLIEELPEDTISRSLTIHKSILPSLRPAIQSTDNSQDNTKGFKLKFVPLADFGFRSTNNEYRALLGLGTEYSKGQKWYGRFSYLQGIEQASGNFKLATPFSSFAGNNIDQKLDLRGRLSYTPNRFVNLQAGYDENFIGEGQRSLLLSDYGKPMGFGEVRLNFWRAEYIILYQFMRERIGANMVNKFGSTHYLNFSATNWLQFGFFESVFFSPKDTLLNRGFEPEYLNPMIFYRPQEYALGSSDNVLLGFDMAADIGKFTFYAQLMLDDFSIAEVKAKSKWWSNKYAIQSGLKTHLKWKENLLFLRSEFNMARPYTYAHLNLTQSYTNRNSVLAHPLGANFYELLFEAKVQRNKWLAEIFVSYSLKGYNDTLNYGGDIFIPYINRPSDYGHTIGQGIHNNAFLTLVRLNYRVFKKNSKLMAFVEYQNRFNTYLIQPKNQVLIGLRSRLWNDYRNY